MSEDTNNNLETHRFRISPESQEILNKQRSQLEKIQERFPQVKGLAWFGSRTKGMERGNSDLDLVVFYDKSEFRETEEERVKRQLETGHYGLSGQVLEYVREELGKSFPNIEMEIKQVDISTEATDRAIENFEIRRLGGRFPLVSRFLLAVGESVYANRAYIFDKLESSPQGEEIFADVMDELQGFERRSDDRINIDGAVTDSAEPQYLRYPQTIEEARKYFLVDRRQNSGVNTPPEVG